MSDDRAFSELSKKEKLARAGLAKRKAESVLTGPNRSTNRKKRADAEGAKKAAGRVEKRLTGPSSKNLTKPGTKGSMGLWEMLKGAIGLPGKLKERLGETEKKSRGGR